MIFALYPSKCYKEVLVYVKIAFSNIIATLKVVTPEPLTIHIPKSEQVHLPACCCVLNLLDR